MLSHEMIYEQTVIYEQNKHREPKTYEFREWNDYMTTLSSRGKVDLKLYHPLSGLSMKNVIKAVKVPYHITKLRRWSWRQYAAPVLPNNCKANRLSNNLYLLEKFLGFIVAKN